MGHAYMAKMSDLITRVKGMVDSFSSKKFIDELEEVQRMVASLQSDQVALEEQNRKLIAENEKLTQAIAALERGPKSAGAQGARREEDLDEIAKKLLIDISNNETPKESIVAFFQLSKADGDAYFDTLEKRGFIRVKYTLDDDVYYIATPEGRAYLENK